MGDVTGGLQFTYISLDDFRIVRDELLGEGKRSTDDRKNVPYSVFMTPPLSRVGITEEQARGKRRGYSGGNITCNSNSARQSDERYPWGIKSDCR